MDDTKLQHHGVKGQKWGVRRFQYESGALTPAGKERYDRLALREMKRDIKKDRKAERKKIKRQRLAKTVATALTVIGLVKMRQARNNSESINSGETATRKALESIGKDTIKIDDDTTFHY